MSYTITCYTLFDITQTNVLNRHRPDMDKEFRYKRNTQSNFDTVQQAISLRSQPEIVRIPEKTLIHPSVFYDGVYELGALYNDCDRVPMIKCHTEWNKLPTFLDGSDELRNIYFKVLTND